MIGVFRTCLAGRQILRGMTTVLRSFLHSVWYCNLNKSKPRSTDQKSFDGFNAIRIHLDQDVTLRPYTY